MSGRRQAPRDSAARHPPAGGSAYAARLPGFVALVADKIAGHASYRLDGPRCELTSIDAEPPHRGTRTLLLEAVEAAARRGGCRSVWLTTTNDNLDGLSFYQRRGFGPSGLRAGAVDPARAPLKPELPAHGMYGIPIRDELDLEIHRVEP